jgi:hypothetical protein
MSIAPDPPEASEIRMTSIAWLGHETAPAKVQIIEQFSDAAPNTIDIQWHVLAPVHL